MEKEFIEVILIIGRIMVLSWFLVNFTPLYNLVCGLPFNYVKNEHMREIIKFIITQPFKCYKCMALWVGLIMTGNIWVALTSSFLMYINEKYLL